MLQACALLSDLRMGLQVPRSHGTEMRLGHRCPPAPCTDPDAEGGAMLKETISGSRKVGIQGEWVHFKTCLKAAPHLRRVLGLGVEIEKALGDQSIAT